MLTLHLAREAARLPAHERALTVRAIAWLLLARAGLRIASFSNVLRFVHAVPPRRPRAHRADRTEYRRALQRAARVLPGSTCLPLAFAGAALLRRDNLGSRLNIHIGLDDQQRFAAHASLTAEDVIVAGAGTALEWRVLMTDPILP